MTKKINEMNINEFIAYIKTEIDEFKKDNLNDFINIKNMTLNDIDNLKGKIYFIQAGDNGAIKIGYTDNIEKRLRQLQTGNPYKLKLLKIINGTYELEKSIHKMFVNDRLEGEWFRPSRRLLNYIDTNKITDDISNEYNYINVFINKYIKINKNSFVESIKLYELYKIFCNDNRIEDVCNNVQFGKAMKLLLPKQIIKKQKRINGMIVWIYSNCIII